MRREIAVALRARSSWAIAALGALLSGHGLLLAVDVYSAASRSALSGSLSPATIDPLAGLVRPALGAAGLTVALLGPLVASRPLAIERERRTLGPLLLHTGSPSRVVLEKAAAGALACSLLLAPSVVLLVATVASGATLDGLETLVAMGGEALRVVVVAAGSTAAACLTKTSAQAAAGGLAISLSSWAIEAADDHAALAWLGPAEALSLDHAVDPFARGVLAPGAIAWALVASAALLLLGTLALSPRLRPLPKALSMLAVALVGLASLAGVSRWNRGYDWSEQRRASLPPAAVAALRALPGPVGVEAWLDRDDPRRRQLSADVLARIELARPDLAVRFPLDRAAAPAEGQREAGYGRVVVSAGGRSLETRSLSRRELVTLIFEAAGRPAPDLIPPPYPGHPAVIDGQARARLSWLAYAGLPIALLAAGTTLSRKRPPR